MKDYNDFYIAAAYGDIEVLRAKLELGVNFEVESADGYTALG